MLRKSPGFTAVAILTLALGIGANTAIFSVIQAVVLNSLPYPHADRLVSLNEYGVQQGEYHVSWMDFQDWRKQSQSFDDMTVYRASDAILTGAGKPEMIRAGQVTSSFFDLTGAKTFIGRAFSADEDVPSATPTAVLTYPFWRARLGGDPAILGKTLTLNDKPFRVVGVMNPEFTFFLKRIDLYIPLGLEAAKDYMVYRGNHQGLSGMARLRPGVARKAAQSEMSAIMERLDKEYPATNEGERLRLTPFDESRLAGFRPALLALLAAVGCVLLIACVNLANLSLARAAVRQREFAIRAAVGAARARILRQLLTESVLLSLFGGAAGFLIASWTIGPLLHFAPTGIPRLMETQMDRGVFLFTFVTALFTGILFGLAPALQASRVSANEALKESGRTSSEGRSHHRLRSWLLISEVALAFMLVIAATLLIRSLNNALHVNLGFRADHVLAMDVGIPEARYQTDPQQLAFLNQALDRIRNLPGVKSASAVMCPPVVGVCWDSVYFLEDRPIPSRVDLPRSEFNIAEPNYFRMMQIPLLRGRLFTSADTPDSVPVIIINETMARRWWPHESPIGKRIKQGFPEPDNKQPFREIVGVVADTRQDAPEQPQWPAVFEPAAQNPSRDWTFLVRTAADPMSMAGAVEGAIQATDKDQPVYHVQPMEQYFSRSLSRRKFSTLLFGLFGGLALLLAAVGIYGVMAYSVSQRTHEIGIRAALGAQRGNLFRLVVRFGLQMAVLGVGIGFLGSLVVNRFLKDMLFGVIGLDPVTYIAVPILLGGVALAACAIPAWRAMRVDPIVALRYE
jgi:putative ABC transport system permease protein